MKNLKNNIFFKLGVILVLILILLIPSSMVKSLIYERESIQAEAIREVSSKWGENQTITGPFISIPYDKYVKQFDKRDSTEKIVKLREWIHVLPEKLNITGQVSPEKRYRGIYEIVVYESGFRIEGNFNFSDLKKFDIDRKNIHFEHATFNVGITDLKGIEKQIKLNWENDTILFNPGTSSRDIVESGINAPVFLQNFDSALNRFALNIELKGSQTLYFVPVGKTTDVSLKSNWTTPSFTGTFLPDNRTINETGFSANWNILHLNRNYPQSWIGSQHTVHESAFGTSLLLPVDNYTKSLRVAKYSILFLTLTFMVFFFVEVLNKTFIHPIQYLLVGIGLVVFYSLLLSLSEHIKFNLAYIISTLLTLILISSYTLAILKSRKLALLIFSILFILYSFIFTIIQLEDYALLIGSLGIFIILGIVMYFSRKIDWYNLSLGENKNNLPIEKNN